MSDEPELDAYGHPRSSRSKATGPGSRGGRWNTDPEYRRAYNRAWKAAHPEYRERERRRIRLARGLDPNDKRVVPAPLPIAVGPCSVCGEAMTYVCDFCRKDKRDR